MNPLLKLKFLLYCSRKRICRAYFTWRVKCLCKSHEDALYINRKSHVTRSTVLGNNIHMNGLDIRGDGSVVIGDNFHCGEDCLIITSDHNYNGSALPYDKSYIHKDVVIEENVWMGSRVIVLGGVRIGEGAILQAGSVVVSDIPACGMAGGHPARVFKTRDVEHYHRLKAEGKIQRYD